jgi:hypothetical protein
MRQRERRRPAFLVWLMPAERALVEQAATLTAVPPTAWCRSELLRAARRAIKDSERRRGVVQVKLSKEADLAAAVAKRFGANDTVVRQSAPSTGSLPGLS